MPKIGIYMVRSKDGGHPARRRIKKFAPAPEPDQAQFRLKVTALCLPCVSLSFPLRLRLHCVSLRFPFGLPVSRGSEVIHTPRAGAPGMHLLWRRLDQICTFYLSPGPEPDA